MARCLQICRASYQEGEIIMVTQEDLFKSVMDDYSGGPFQKCNG